jgi:hypothetical protein
MIFVHMEMSQGNSLHYLKNAIFFSFTKLEEGRTGPAWVVGIRRREEDVERGCRRVNMVQILCTHVCKWKNDTIPGMEGNKGE